MARGLLGGKGFRRGGLTNLERQGQNANADAASIIRGGEVSSIGIQRPRPQKSPEQPDVMDLTPFAKEISSRAYETISQSAQDEEAEAYDQFLQIVQNIFNGELYKDYDYTAFSALSKQIKAILPAYREQEYKDFKNLEGPVAIEQFDHYFRNKIERLAKYFDFQRRMSKIHHFSEEVGGDARQEFVRQDSFDKEFITDFARTINYSCFNIQGFEELKKSHEELDALFSNGKFDSTGISLLENARSGLPSLMVSLSRDFTGISDDVVGLFHNTQGILQRIKEKNWTFEGDDLTILRQFYKLDNPFEDQKPKRLFQHCVQNIEQAIRRHSQPSMIMEGLLSADNIAQINLAKNIIRNAYGEGGIIANSDLESIGNTAMYLKDVLREKQGLLTEKEIEIIRQIICEIEVICNPEYRFGPTVNIGLFLETCANKSPETLAIAKRELRKHRQPSYQQGRSTTVLEPSLLRAAQERNGIVVDQNLQTDAGYLQKIKYCAGSQNFDKVLSESLEFENLLREIAEAEESHKFDELVNLLYRLNIPPIFNLEVFIENDLERHLIARFAQQYRGLESKEEQKAFEEKFETHRKNFEIQKALLIEKLLHIATLKHVFIDDFDSDMDPKTKIILSFFDAFKFRQGLFEKYNNPTNEKTFKNLILYAQELNTLDTLLAMLKKIFGIEIEQIFKDNLKPLQNAIEDFILGICDFASQRNFRAEYIQNSTEIAKLRKIANFCIEIRSRFPSDDKSAAYTKKILNDSISKFDAN